MNHQSICLALIPAALFLLIASNVQADETVKSTELGNTVHVIGQLGKELGTVVEVTGLASKTQPSKDKGNLVFEIMKVDDVTLDEPVQIGLQFQPSSTLLETNGNVVAKFRGYETGAFIGIPSQANIGSDTQTTRSTWKFHTYFKVIK